MQSIRASFPCLLEISAKRGYYWGTYIALKLHLDSFLCRDCLDRSDYSDHSSCLF